jgi:hypothetical protein
MSLKTIFDVACSLPVKVITERLKTLRLLLFSNPQQVEAGHAIDNLTKLGSFISEMCKHKTDGVFRFPPIIIVKVEKDPGKYQVLVKFLSEEDGRIYEKLETQQSEILDDAAKLVDCLPGFQELDLRKMLPSEKEMF